MNLHYHGNLSYLLDLRSDFNDDAPDPDSCRCKEMSVTPHREQTCGNLTDLILSATSVVLLRHGGLLHLHHHPAHPTD